MSCPRGRSLLVPEIFVDYEADSGAMSFLGYRCVICGDVLDTNDPAPPGRPSASMVSATRRRRPPVFVGRKTGAEGEHARERSVE